MLVRFLSTWHKLELPGDEESQSWNCPHQITLWPYMWDFSFTDDWQIRSRPLWVLVLSFLCRWPWAEPATGSRVRKSCSLCFLKFLTPGFFLEFLFWFLSVMDSKKLHETSHFLNKLFLVIVLSQEQKAN